MKMKDALSQDEVMKAIRAHIDAHTMASNPPKLNPHPIPYSVHKQQVAEFVRVAMTDRYLRPRLIQIKEFRELASTVAPHMDELLAVFAARYEGGQE